MSEAIAYPSEWYGVLTSWLYDRATRLTLDVLAAGPIPQHIGFIMDGNRRYARHEGKAIKEGHADGFASLQRILECLLKLRVKCVTVYAFAIENFNRTPEEVDALMKLLREKLIEISRKGQLLDQYGVRLNVIGERGMLPQDVQEIAQQVETMTEKTDRAILNICMPYASRNEIAASVRVVIDEKKSGITEHDIDRYLETNARGSPPLDILVRTSGVHRLSDFLLWQSCDTTQIQFTPGYWPDFGLRDLVPIILDYQLKCWNNKVQVALS
ncbi:Di-trans-poly-cis-decaprenylcistransferase [Dacryopinax primogenitus]|uniref:Alkyl transferase n=1 Tax=Dacryopinax primogenitus (strain DJM 731) TaxID=1858805 RepID=M5G4M6_DACPD|nr:Di-trans-poly-cis-decaprenylcistransferase [Dacryopinax primogenitus]EJU00812.1 Di-trans-poly-cis-decaprenylcistransferase [Dacryopinax primogenitus]